MSIDQRAFARRDPIEAVLREAHWRPANVPFAVSAEVKGLATWIGVLVLAGVLVALGYVWVRLRVVEIGYRLSAVQQLVGRLEQEAKELAVEAAAADTPGRLEEEARRRLGLQRPQPEQLGSLQ
ncbi:MAG: cell division protein FtsL [Deltaproteobacteria bacterium]|nr:cell division protein FtsL [Deltaproteobacteria bacterium]